MKVPYLDNPPAMVPIDVGRQLFVDDFLIESTTLTRTYYTAEYHPNNPVIRPEEEMEFDNDSWWAAPFSGGTFYDSEESLFKIWYTAGNMRHLALATSVDGVHWDKPIYDVTGFSNLVLPGNLNGNPDSYSVLLDHHDTDLNKRFKYFTTEWNGEISAYAMTYRTSADGIHWSDPIAYMDMWGDRSTVFYNPFRKEREKYVAWGRSFS
jgi:hypothetical protein